MFVSALLQPKWSTTAVNLRAIPLLVEVEQKRAGRKEAWLAVSSRASRPGGTGGPANNHLQPTPGERRASPLLTLD